MLNKIADWFIVCHLCGD